MEEPIRVYVLHLARAYGEARGIALTTVSRRFHGSVSFFDQFDKGRCSVTLRKMQAMIDSFHDDWPEEIAFPEPLPMLIKLLRK